MPHSESPWAFGEWIICPRQNQMTKADHEAIPIKPRLMRVWHFLMLHRGEIVRRIALTEAVWPERSITNNLVAKSISELRQVLLKYFGRQIRIETIRGIGYRLKADQPLDRQILARHLPRA
ncbi:MAG: winged helix-turn-helix domain-containing protein [Bacteroidota bacterium]